MVYHHDKDVKSFNTTMQYELQSQSSSSIQRQTKRGLNSVNSYNSQISYKNSINNADPCTFQIIWYLKHSTLKKKINGSTHLKSTMRLVFSTQQAQWGFTSNKAFPPLLIILSGEDPHAILHVLVGILLTRDQGFSVSGKRFFCRCFCTYRLTTILIVVYDCG